MYKRHIVQLQTLLPPSTSLYLYPDWIDPESVICKYPKSDPYSHFIFHDTPIDPMNEWFVVCVYVLFCQANTVHIWLSK
jgi:hypothetical protein